MMNAGYVVLALAVAVSGYELDDRFPVPGVQHAFMRDTSPREQGRRERQDAWDELMEDFPYDCVDERHCALRLLGWILSQPDVGEPVTRARRSARERGLDKVCRKLDTLEESSGKVRRKLRRLPEEQRAAALQRIQENRASKLACCQLADTDDRAECFELLHEQKWARICAGEEELNHRKITAPQDILDDCCGRGNPDDVEECFSQQVRSAKRTWKRERAESRPDRDERRSGRQERRQNRQERRQTRLMKSACCAAGTEAASEDGTAEQCQAAFASYTEGQGLDDCQRWFDNCCKRESGILPARPNRRRPSRRGSKEVEEEE